MYQSPTHDPLALCVIPSGLPFWRHRKDTQQQAEQGHDIPITRSRAKRSKSGSAPDDSEEPESLLPPDEVITPTKTLRNGKVTKYAGTVTLVHVPSLPIRTRSRFPLDEQGSTDGATPATEAERSRPALSGISVLNPGLIERDPPSPITGWALDVPLDEQDLAFEPSTESNSHEGDAMEVDSPTHTTESHDANSGSSDRKGKRGEKDSHPVEDSKTDPIRVRIQTAAMGMGGKVIVVLGTRGIIWVYRIKNGC